MEEKIISALLKRPGMEGNPELIKEMVHDSILELKIYLNYTESEELPEACGPAVKELALIRYNRDGTEGIKSETQSSGGGTTYTDELPERVKRVIRKCRRLPR